jgi:hypothetical protein
MGLKLIGSKLKYLMISRNIGCIKYIPRVIDAMFWVKRMPMYKIKIQLILACQLTQ